MVPSSVEKRTVAGALWPPSLITKSEVSLVTWPLGVELVPGGLPAGGGVTTGGPRGVPAAAERAAGPPPLVGRGNWPAGGPVKAPGVTPAGAGCGARPGTSDTRAGWVKAAWASSRQRGSRPSRTGRQVGPRIGRFVKACPSLRNQVYITLSC